MVDSPEGILFKALFGLIVVLVGAIIYLIVARLIGGPSNLIARLCNSLFSIDEKGKQRSPEEDPYFHEKKHGRQREYRKVIARRLQHTFTYNNGRVFQYRDEDRDCVFYDIDCGKVFRYWGERESRLACIRLEDESITYI